MSIQFKMVALPVNAFTLSSVVLFFSSLCLLITNTHCNIITVSFMFEEDQDANALVGQISNSAQWRHEQHDVGPAANNMKFELLASGRRKVEMAHYFYVDSKSGEIRTRVKIDRDQLCARADLCCADQMFEQVRTTTTTSSTLMLCNLDLSVKAISEAEKVTIVNVRISLIDRNDNAPRWQNTRVLCQVDESSYIPMKIDLPLATDLDAGTNGIVLYRLANVSQKEGVFILHTVKEKLGGSTSAKIVKLQLFSTVALDREQKDKYLLSIIAQDGGENEAELFVDIMINDVNDNAPQFKNDTISIKIAEDTSQHQQLLRLQAFDKDVGKNGHVRYRLGKEVSDTAGETRRQSLHQMFAIDPEQGWLMLIGTLDYESRRQYTVPIEAFDNGEPSRSSQTILTVDVLDVNDEKPYIEIHPVKGLRVCVTENQLLGGEQTIATIRVSDRDSGLNGNVLCQLKEGQNDFALELLAHQDLFNAPNYYNLRAQSSFDREKQSTYMVVVLCVDKGSPSQSTTKRFDVHVIDVNDNTPMFSPTATYQMDVAENRPSNTIIGKVRAIDDDAYQNGEVRYHLKWINQTANVPVVHIDEKTGVIYSVSAFDREVQETFVFHIIAEDCGQPEKRSSTATVSLKVTDENDNAPIFCNSTPSKVVVSESIGLQSFSKEKKRVAITFIANISASDADTGVNSKIDYSILHIMSSKGALVSQQHFFLLNDHRFGVWTGRLDREQEEQYVVTIEARDNGHPARSTTTKLTVEVEDANDNTPRFLWPTDATGTLNISSNVEVGTVVAKIKAIDNDLGENGTLTYRIKSMRNANDASFFEVEPRSGDLHVVKSLAKNERHYFELLLECNDQGKPPRVKTQRLQMMSVPLDLHKDVIRNRNRLGQLRPRKEKDEGEPSREEKSSWKKNVVSYAMVVLVAGLILLLLILIFLTSLYFMRRCQRATRRLAKNKPGEITHNPMTYDAMSEKVGGFVQPNSHVEENCVSAGNACSTDYLGPRELNKAVELRHNCCSDESILKQQNDEDEPKFESQKDYIKQVVPTLLVDVISVNQRLKEKWPPSLTASFDKRKFEKTKIYDDYCNSQVDSNLTSNYSMPLEAVIVDNRHQCPRNLSLLDSQISHVDYYSEYCVQNAKYATKMGLQKKENSINVTTEKHLKYPYDHISNV